jgi:hypothetical protein
LDTSFDEFKALRLVCRRFNGIVKPRVYSSHIKLFDDEHLSSNMDQLLTLLSSKPNEQLHATTTLFIGNRDWLDRKGVSIPFREVAPVIANLFDGSTAIVHYLASPITEPRNLLQRVVTTALRVFARLRLYLPVSQFKLPNVSRVVYVVYLFSGTLLT